MEREFIYSDEKSNKFWRIELNGSEFTTTYGRVGASGQSTIKQFSSDEKAFAASEKLIEQKVSKGYVETSPSAAKKKAATKKAATKKAAPKAKKKAAKKPAVKKSAKSKKSAPAAEAEAPVATTTLKNARLFVFDDGASKKFWAIALSGSSHTVNYGRIGAGGQTKEKKFASKEQAQASYDKLVGEKLAKAYVELDENGQPIIKPIRPKPGKSVRPETAMEQIYSKEPADGLTCHGTLDFRGERKKRGGRKQSKRAELPNFLTADSVVLTDCKWVEEIPVGWSVDHFWVDGCENLKQIGAELKCYELNANGAGIETLPDDVAVEYRIDLSDCKKLKSLPENLKVTTLNLAGCTALTKLPEGLEVAFLDITGCTSLTSFPKKGNVHIGNLIARGCTNLASLPNWLKLLCRLDIQDCPNITSLPSGLNLRSRLDFAGSGLTKLPTKAKRATLVWRDVPIDYRTAFQPHKLKGKDVLAEENVERRRVMMQQMGFQRFLKEVDAEVLDSDTDPGGERQLLRVRMQNDEDLVCVSVNCPSTGRHYMIRVPPTTQTCHQGIAWTAGFSDPDDYKPKKET